MRDGGSIDEGRSPGSPPLLINHHTISKKEQIGDPKVKDLGSKMSRQQANETYLTLIYGRGASLLPRSCGKCS